ncbi:MAG: ribonuclease P protein component [Bacteroides sp.]|nr:ribonuclease P protein component [Bacteroides sp.]
MNEEKEITEKEKVRLTLKKEEKLRHKSLVDPLFRDGQSLYEFPLRLVWRLLTPEDLKGSFKGELPERIGKVQMLITIPKKKRRHAVDRVLMRRRIREAYRLCRKELLERVVSSPKTGTLSMAFIYIHNENLPYATIERKIKSLLKKMAKGVAKSQEEKN